MDCPSCAGKIENALKKVEGVSSQDTQLTSGKVVVSGDRASVPTEEITEAIKGAGYQITDSTTANTNTGEEPSEKRESVWTCSRAVKTWISGGFVAL